MTRTASGGLRGCLFVFTASLLLAGCSRDATKAPDQPADTTGDRGTALPRELTLTREQVRHGKVAWETVTMTIASATATVPGALTVNEDRTSRLGAPARARVVDVRVRPGDRVSRGQLLARLQSPDAAMAQSDLSKANSAVASARAQMSYSRSARDRAERLLTLKVIPRQEYERAVADYELARATLDQAEAEAARARSTAAQLGAAGALSGEIALRSPLTGVVLARPAVSGSVVEAGAPLVIVTDPSTLWLAVNAPENLSGLFRRGSALRFTVPAYVDEVFTARIDAVGAGLDPQTRTLPVRALVPNPNLRLKPEMFANVSVEGGTSAQAVMLPDEAVQRIDGKPTVFLAQPDSKGNVRIRPRVVQTGPRANGRVAIVAGLATGEIVITRGAFVVKAQFQKGSMPDMEM